MAIRFLSSAELDVPLPIIVILAGVSGSGKTRTALALAAGLADARAGRTGAPFAFVDTENRRGLFFRTEYPQALDHYMEVRPDEDGYSPEVMIQIIDELERKDVGAAIIDSASHWWEGHGGVLELQAEEHERLGGSDATKLLSWAKPRARWRKALHRMLSSRVNIILCVRAKPMIQQRGKNLYPTKLRREDVPYDVALDKELVFEVTVFALLDPARPGAPAAMIKVGDQHRHLFRIGEVLDEHVGSELFHWSCDSSRGLAQKALLDGARAAAKQGRDALNAFYKPLPNDDKAIVAVIMDELRAIVAEAATNGPPDEAIGEDAAESEEAQP
jgi:hypothetical protein